MNLTGLRFGRLTVIGRSPRKGSSWWVCRCDCGNESVTTSTNLRTGKSRSCGCLRREVTTARSTKHGLMAAGMKGPTYHSWSNMIRRCTNPDHPRYADWGGRGITVCARWRDYPNFLADMGEKPPGTTLGRIDNDGGYEPDNCRWETHQQQARNQRSTRLTVQVILRIRDLHAQRLGIQDIAKKVGVGRHTVGTVCAVVDALADG